MLLKDLATAADALNTFSRELENMPPNDPRRENIMKDWNDLRDIEREIEETRLLTARRTIERNGGDSEEQRAKERAEREARVADVRAGNEIVARQAAVNRAPWSQSTIFSMLDARNPWPDRPNYWPGITRY